MSRPRTIDAAIRRLEGELPAGFAIEDITTSTSWGSRDATDPYKEGVGAYRRHHPSWCVTVAEEGWEDERRSWFQWGATIRDACLKLAWSIRRARRHPHLTHLGIEGPGEIQRPAYFLRECEECVTEARELFDNEVAWVA